MRVLPFPRSFPALEKGHLGGFLGGRRRGIRQRKGREIIPVNSFNSLFPWISYLNIFLRDEPNWNILIPVFHAQSLGLGLAQTKENLAGGSKNDQELGF